ncbi:MAG: Gldg family protein [Syntrophobacteraceae bacterium]|nr:Gldg family protein [Syntrophobacteraceae bacterium]
MPAKNGRKLKWAYGTNSVVSTVIFFLILVFIILIAQQKPWRADLTGTKSFTLSQQTQKILKTIKSPISIKIFISESGPGAQGKDKIKDLLDTYCYYSKNVKYQFVDPDTHPQMTRSYGVKTYGTMVLEGYGKKQSIQTADEQDITNALLKLQSKVQEKIYFLSGHGEHSISAGGRESFSVAKAALEKDFYKVAEFNLLELGAVPADAAAVIIAGPDKPVPQREQQILSAYLAGGGRVFLMIDPLTQTGMTNFLKGYGIGIGDDVVVDRLSRLFGASPTVPVVMRYADSPITKDFTEPTFYPYARSVSPLKNPPAGVTLQTIAATSASAWADRNLDELKKGKAEFDKTKDLPGPVPLVLMATIQAAPKAGAAGKQIGAAPQAKSGKLIVSGNSLFAANSYFNQYGNGDLFLNTVSYLCNQTNLITIQRPDTNKPLMLTSSQATSIFWTVLILVPLAVLVSGVAVYRIRRSQR